MPKEIVSLEQLWDAPEVTDDNPYRQSDMVRIFGRVCSIRAQLEDVYRRASTNPLENPIDARLVKDGSALNLKDLLPCIETRLYGLILETGSEELIRQGKFCEVELWKSLNGKDSYFDQVSKEDNIEPLMIDLQAIDYMKKLDK